MFDGARAVKPGTIDRMHAFERMELGRSVDPFVNLATVNYILAGIQRFWNKPERVKWQQLMVDMDFGVPSTSAKTDFAVQVILIACYKLRLLFYL